MKVKIQHVRWLLVIDCGYASDRGKGTWVFCQVPEKSSDGEENSCIMLFDTLVFFDAEDTLCPVSKSAAGYSQT